MSGVCQIGADKHVAILNCGTKEDQTSVATRVGMRSGDTFVLFLPVVNFRNGGFPDFQPSSRISRDFRSAGFTRHKKSTLCAYQMAHPGAIAHSRAHLCPQASISPLRPLGLGSNGSWQRSESFVFLRRYGRRSGQPSSSSLARRACVHVLPFSWYSCFYAVRRYVTGTRLQVRLLGHPELRKRPWPLLRPRGDGNGGGLPSTLYTRCCPFVPCTATVH